MWPEWSGRALWRGESSLQGEGVRVVCSGAENLRFGRARAGRRGRVSKESLIPVDFFQ